MKKDLSHQSPQDRADYLRENADFVPTILEGFPGRAIIAADFEGDVILYNDGARQIYGYAPEEISGKKNIKLFFPGEFIDAGKLPRLITSLRKKGKLSWEGEQVRKDGERFPARIRLSLLKDKKGRALGFMETVEDITGRKQAEEEQIKEISGIGNAMGDGLLLYTADGKITFVNLAFEKMTSGESCELVGKNAAEMARRGTKPGDMEKITAAMEASLMGEVPVSASVTLTSKKGRETPVLFTASWIRDAEGKPSTGIVVFKDISALKRAEEKKRETAANILAVEMIEGMPDAVTLYDLNGTIRQVNSAFEKGLGWKREEMIGKTALEVGFVSQEEGQRIEKEMIPKLVKEGFVRDFETTGTRRDGTQFPVLMSWALMKDDEGRPAKIIAVAKDITERRKLEEKYRELVETERDIIYSLDVRGNITFASPAVERILHYRPDEVTGKSFMVLIPKEWQEKTLTDFNNLLKIGKITADTILLDKEKQPHFVEYSSTVIKEDNKVVGTRGIARDITARKKAEEALIRLSNAVKMSTDSVVISNLEGKIVEVNEATLEMYGIKDKRDLIGKNSIDLISPEDRERAFAGIKETLEKGYIKNREYYITAKDGSKLAVEMNVGVMKDMDGKPMGFVGISRDITGRREAEAKRRELEQKAQVASRLSIVGEMASGIAHEVNNPLTSVIGFAWLLMQKDVPEDIKEYTRYIHEGAERVASIVGRLLTFSHQQKPEKTYADINRILETTLQLQAYEMKTSNIKVTTNFDLDLPQIVVDPGQLQQVFLNIILNAATEMKLARKGGNLLVKTERIDDIIRISFTDDGPGIAEENLERIFEPFFTTRKPGMGTGLGLSVCHGIIAEHNGQIYARNNPDRGATFVVELPITTEPPEPARSAADESGKTRGAKILVVDDEPATLQLLSQVLSVEGYEVQTVDNADDALEMIKNKSYDLILLDIKMPGMSGIELYRDIQEAASPLIRKMVFITGDSMSDDTKDFFTKSKARCIIKPFNIVQLKRDINYLLSRRA